MVAEQLNVELIFYKAPEKRLQYSLKNNHIDALFKSQAWVSNKSDYYWSDPIVIMVDLFISDNKIAYEFSTFESLQPFIINTHIGYSYPKLEGYFDSGEIKHYDYRTELLMFKAAIADGNTGERITLINKFVAKYIPVIIQNAKFSKW